ncbi:MAG: GNAT family N-acetyltransferase [Lachnospiraceae bacterium]|nr:GNAT family N-acetyltransferase [Lachnospiraceae bacterium]
MIEIRDARLTDAERLLEIYDYYVKNTATSFEYDTPSVEEFRNRMENVMKRYPYLVILKDNVIEGYAYAHAFVGREAYDWSCEMTIYLNHDACKCGMGRKIYEAIEDILKKMGVTNLYACIGTTDVEDEYLNNNSANFHEHLGYVKVGEFNKCGYKFNRWYNMIWMEKIIGEYNSPKEKIKDYPSMLADDIIR